MTTPTTTQTGAVAALRATWRRTREHYQAQARRFLSIFGGLLLAQVLGDLTAGKTPLAHPSARSLWVYAVPVLYTAYRQWRPELGAKAVDSAPGAAIVPAQVGLAPADLTAPEAPLDLASIPADLPQP